MVYPNVKHRAHVRSHSLDGSHLAPSNKENSNFQNFQRFSSKNDTKPIQHRSQIIYNGVNIDKKLNYRHSPISIPQDPAQILKARFQKPPPVIQLYSASIQILQSITNLEKSQQEYPVNCNSLVNRSSKHGLSSSVTIWNPAAQSKSSRRHSIATVLFSENERLLNQLFPVLNNNPNLDIIQRPERAYTGDILRHIFEKKNHNQPEKTQEYLDKQPELNRKMRAILIDWLIDVHRKFKMNTETL
jgi:hypothetical protein